MAERAREPSPYLAERHVLYSNIMAVSTAGSTRASISGISAKTAKTCMAITSKASSNTGIGISANTSIANNSTAFGLSSLSLRSERGTGRRVILATHDKNQAPSVAPAPFSVLSGLGIGACALFIKTTELKGCIR